MSTTKARTPKAMQEKKLTLAEAADIYESATKAIKSLEESRDEAKAVLLAHFERTGRAGYKDRIGWKWNGGGRILDQAAAKKLLGIATPYTTSKRSRSLTLLR